MVDVLRLKAKVLEKGFTIASLADAMQIDRTTLYRRIADEGKSFTIGELDKIVTTLSLTEEEVKCIFFVSKVA